MRKVTAFAVLLTPNDAHSSHWKAASAFLQLT